MSPPTPRPAGRILSLASELSNDFVGDFGTTDRSSPIAPLAFPACRLQRSTDFNHTSAEGLDTLVRRLGLAVAPRRGLALQAAETVNRQEMDELLGRSPEAYQFLEQHGRAIVLEALRPSEADAELERFLERFIQAADRVAHLLGQVMQDRKVEPHLNALQPALEEYTACDRRFFELVAENDATLAGWMHQKRAQTPSYALLRQNWEQFRTRHRKLYKAHRKLFDQLGEWL